MLEPLSTQALIRNYQLGDRNALEELYRRYWKRVLSAVRFRLGRKLRRKLESADVVQRVLMDALKKLDSFDFSSEGAFMRYLNQQVEYRIRDEADKWNAQIRSIDREISLDDARSDGSGYPLNHLGGPSTLTPGQIAVLHEDLARLETAMDVLAERAPEYHEILIAVKLEGRTYRELAAESGASADAIRMKCNRATAALICAFRDLDSSQKQTP